MNDTFILMVEDDPLDAELMLVALADAEPRARVELATSAETAWTMLEDLHAAHNLSTLAMILLDLQLRGMSGLELLKRIRVAAGTRRVPVVILTSSLEPVDIEACYDAGANSYLVKPETFGELLELADRVHRYWTVDNRRPTGDVA